jgi:hypothetical protein
VFGEPAVPIHDWTRPPVGLYHHFHQQWAGELCNALNAGVLPAGYFALVDQRAVGLVPDVLALRRHSKTPEPAPGAVGVAVATAPPAARYTTRETDEQVYAARANRVAVRNPLGELVALIEIVSPGNKDSRHALRSFVDKAVEFLARGVNLLVIDPFPPTPRDPQGIHKAIWDEIREEPFELPSDKPLTIAAYTASPAKAAYVNFVAPGDPLPAAPLFLDDGTYIPAPLEVSYTTTWAKCPLPFREAVEAGAPSGHPTAKSGDQGLS